MMLYMKALDDVVLTMHDAVHEGNGLCCIDNEMMLSMKALDDVMWTRACVP